MSENKEDQSNEITEREYKEFFLPPLEGGDLDWFMEDEFEPKKEPASKYGFCSSSRGILIRGPPGAGKSIKLSAAFLKKSIIKATKRFTKMLSGLNTQSPITVMFDEAEKLLMPRPPFINKYPYYDYKKVLIKRKLGGKIVSSSKMLRNLNLAVR